MLEVRGLTKRFGDEVVLDGLDLAVRKGEVVVVLGPSGCGKSTLLRCIAGLEGVDAGEVRLEGEPISGTRRDSALRQRLGMVFQSYDLFPTRTVLANVTLAPVVVQHRDRLEAEREAEALLRRVGLWDKRDSYPSTLSGGQRQRVAICRALAMHPDVMLLDEVTAALDPEMVHEVLDVVLELAEGGLTMVIVTHEMRFAAAIADRVVMLDGGEVVEESDDPAAFFERPETGRAREFLSMFEYKREKGKGTDHED
ncbi:MAG: amino acid ABC transporter ATP-binding protein [Atopobiaceae bacterium]|nr:amino acid ABC transporter ATP-binding protein [Atopobiaceae bacterium]